MNIEYQSRQKEAFQDVKLGTLFKTLYGGYYIKGYDSEDNSVAIDIKDGGIDYSIKAEDTVFVIHHKVVIYND